ncbi:MAG: hypothetical protein JWM11_2587 [Planctomycetaceae bacterium]|nr:hypothetical protein [Planctomycetaceae bacterium]
MPIKFRCQHCKQLLGIAHSKAGSLVDCPTCGRTLRVPNLDGSIDPQPAIGMNLADHDLRRALDELGQIGQEPASPIEDETFAKITSKTPVAGASRHLNPDPGGLTSESEQSAELPAYDLESKLPPAGQLAKSSKQVIERAPDQNPLPAPALPISRVQSIALEPLPSLIAIDPPQNSRGAPQLAGSGREQTAASHAEILADLARQANSATPTASQLNSPIPRQKRSISWNAAIGIGVTCLLTGAAIGFSIGRIKPASSRFAAPLDGLPAADLGKNTTGPAETAPRLMGRLTYRNSQGRIEPDAGARILAIPEIRSTESKLPSIGFRPADDEVSRETAHRALLESGGSEATADVRGQYELKLPAGGTFQLVVLSKYQGRQSDTTWPKSAEATLRAVFERPEQLVGSLAFHVETIQNKDDGTLTWNHAFERE